jgi:hypothetical protein
MDIDVKYDKTAWDRLRIQLKAQFKRRPDIQGIIFLIGHRELGQARVDFDKSAKEDLLHVGTCTLLSRIGYYSYIARDEEGWPHYEVVKGMPKLKPEDQESLLKKLIIDYFDEMNSSSN